MGADPLFGKRRSALTPGTSPRRLCTLLIKRRTKHIQIRARVQVTLPASHTICCSNKVQVSSAQSSAHQSRPTLTHQAIFPSLSLRFFLGFSLMRLLTACRHRLLFPLFHTSCAIPIVPLELSTALRLVSQASHRQKKKKENCTEKIIMLSGDIIS